MRLAPLLLVLAAPLAHADTVDVNVDVHVSTDGAGSPPIEHPRLRGSHWEAAAFLEGGRISLGDAAGGQAGLRGEVARQFGALRIAVEGSVAKFMAQRDLYDSAGWWDGWEDVGGEVSRVGVTARLRAGGFGSTVEGGFYVEGGIGQQYIAWDDGRSGTRRDFILGGGMELAGGGERMGGVDFHVRAIVAPSLETAVETHDVGVLVGLGGRFGI